MNRIIHYGMTVTDNLISKNYCLKEEYFPKQGQCCKRSEADREPTIKKLCPHCRVWMSFIDSNSLAGTTVIECVKFGYEKRIKI